MDEEVKYAQSHQMRALVVNRSADLVTLAATTEERKKNHKIKPIKHKKKTTTTKSKTEKWCLVSISRSSTAATTATIERDTL